jgi:acetoacetyl-CoA synthetase
MFPRPSFFKGAKLNFAQNLLYPKAKVDPDGPAIISANESERSTVTWVELRQQVRSFQASMITVGVQEGDRVAGYAGNHTTALVAMLAATSLGAIWTAVSTDTGVHAVLERLKQIEPKLLICDNAAKYNGKTHNVLTKVQEIADQLPNLEVLVILKTVPGAGDASMTLKYGKVISQESFLDLGQKDWLLQFKQFPADHPVYILYSSGTTGAPKCIVHGSIGTLIQHKKEHLIHCSITPSSRLFYFTTVSWMMWHWLVSGLASGATLVLYDGSPFRYKSAQDQSGSAADDMAMPRLVEELKITHFGTSAKYLSVLEQRHVLPNKALDLSSLQAIYSTGSPLAPSTFSYVYAAFPATINLGSITGGTDIVSLFGAPSPLSAVHAGEIQVAGLGMAIRAWEGEEEEDGRRDVTAAGEPGELVCTRAFPCQPVSFWGAGGAAKYRASYFDRFPKTGVWAHGDFVRFNPRTGGLVMLGRSDGVLKPAGVRFGSAEIYNVLLRWFPEEVADALCIGRRREGDVDETVVLFVKMEAGVSFSEALAGRIRAVVRRELSARHVPGAIDECPEIPVTSNGKK